MLYRFKCLNDVRVKQILSSELQICKCYECTYNVILVSERHVFCCCNRWGFVTHGCIDGYSRLVTFLQTGTSNTASAVLNLFVQASYKYGLPSRVRCDRGGENVNVALFMNLVRGTGRSSVILGKSVHNQRIERLWRDVATQITEFYHTLFYQLED